MSTQDDLSFIAEALPAFISEADEQLASLEQLLLELEEHPGERTLLDGLFRSAHTIKGSAGIFGLQGVVDFTHHVEGLLDRMREGQVALTPAISTVLLRCGDMIRHLIAVARDPALDTDERVAQRAALVAQVLEFSGVAPGAAPAVATGSTAVAATTPQPGQADGARTLHVTARFGADTFRNGMDPLAIVTYLRRAGEVSDVHLVDDAIPAIGQLDPETCHMALAFDFHGEDGRAAIDSAFCFVQDDCALTVQEQPQPAGVCASPDCGDAAAVAQPAPVTAQTPPTATVAAEHAEAGARKHSAAEEPRYIRVRADRLDAVINLLGELVVASAGAEMLAAKSRQGSLIEANQQIGRLIEEIRNGTLQLRMVPIGETFGRFRRVVRDVASELGKEVEFQTTGGDTELDKSVVEKIVDPLMHLVRNSLDHGLETPEQREAAGKPAQGTLHLAARHEAGSILISIEDDGRGIDRARVLARAIERGLVDPQASLTDNQIQNLIFHPGFSTAERVTNLSGRGVGMDVVRSNIEALRGTVQIASVQGQGMRVSIRLPLTLAIIDGFLVGVGDSSFVFPLESVLEVIERREATTDSQGRYCVELRGSMLPVLGLRRIYGIDGAAGERASIVVVQAGDTRFGVEVDALLGQHQTVIKPLARIFKALPGISGSTILGNGEVALIFDILSLAELAQREPESSPNRRD